MRNCSESDRKARTRIKEAPIQAKYRSQKHSIKEGFKPPNACQSHGLASVREMYLKTEVTL